MEEHTLERSASAAVQTTRVRVQLLDIHAILNADVVALGGGPIIFGGGGLAVGFACSARFFGQNCSKTPNMGWIVDWRGWGGPEVPEMEVRFFPMAARSTVRGSKLG